MKERALATSSTESSPKTPSGPRGHFLLGHAPDVRHDVQTFCLRLAHEYGDVARIRLLATPVYLVSHPDGIRQILQKKHLNYDRYSFSYKPMRPFLGNGREMLCLFGERFEQLAHVRGVIGVRGAHLDKCTHYVFSHGT